MMPAVEATAFTDFDRGPVLHPYRQRGHEQIRAAYRSGYRRVLLVAPTGSGKTVVFVHAAARVGARGSIVLSGVHRIEVLDQTIEKLRDCGIECWVIAAGQSENYARHAQVTLISTLVQRGRKRGQFRNIVDFVLVDGAHHCVAKTWLATIPEVLSRNAYLLGVTATPERLDGRGLVAGASMPIRRAGGRPRRFAGRRDAT